jgi:hypothetical protein
MRLGFNTRALTRAIIAVAFIPCSTRGLSAQSNWDRYVPGTLSAVMRDADSAIRASIRETEASLSADSTDKLPSQHFLGDQYPTLATVVYKGQSRAISKIRHELIGDWGRSFMRDSSIAADFHREYLFLEGDRLLWLPVQDRVASYFPKELRSGQKVNLYVMLLAGYYDKGAITWGFIVNEFKAVPAASTY